ncbi:MAG TPA: hypothetical protein VMD91_07195 [Candidatus Sulfotelmatobacter sp.]|nr:hypothetical protein [Candidatus Sulfotelmatobacter sp.]
MKTVLFALLVAFVALTGLAQAQTDDVRGQSGSVTRVFRDVYVPPGEVVDGDVDVVFGNAQIAGIVTGNCSAVFGNCMVVDGGEIGGHLSTIGPGGFVPIPWVNGEHAGYGFAEQDRALLWRFASSAVVLLMFLLFPLRMRLALDRVERHPALAAATGVFAFLAVIPIAIVLCISVIGIPLLPVEILAVLAGLWLGTGAIALVIGRRLCELVMPSTTPSPLLALILGLVVVSAAETVPGVGLLVTALVWLVGLGAAILTCVRSTQIETAVHRAPIGGPPMQGWR